MPLGAEKPFPKLNFSHGLNTDETPMKSVSVFNPCFIRGQ